MKLRILAILSAIFQGIDTILCLLRLKRPKVIVFVDGGICSQMLMYIQGQYYAEHGLDVRYDLQWFQVHGKDANGIMPRTFEFTEMWPDLEFRPLPGWQRKWYLLFFKAGRSNGDMLPEPQTITHSIYLDGWWDLPKGESLKLYNQYFILQNAASPSVQTISNFENVVGVHVRRGDLAKGDNPIYGGVSEGYFIRAIEFCNQKFSPKKYIFFSDEPDWVELNICPHLKQSYEIMRNNKAWEDLWFLSQCPVIVASQGSFGRVAAKLNKDAVLIQCDNKHANRDREKCFFIE